MRADEEGNMNEKMTDEELNRVLESMGQHWSMRASASIRAHIAAVTTERDNMHQEAIDAISGLLAIVEVLTDDKKEPGLDAARRVVAERDALRERVQALEAEVKEQSARKRQFMQACDRHESRLAAIRRRAGDETALVRHAEVGAIMGAGSTDWDEEIHAEVVQRGDAETLRGAALAAARCILGDDARPPAPPEAFTHEKGLDAGVFDEAPEETKAERLIREEREASAEMVRRAAEPTTSDAFATVREYIHGDRTQIDHEDVERASRVLSLLERHMGAQNRALREVLKLHHRMPGDVIKQIQAALDDAPPVFTLEEVEAAMTGIYGPAPVLERLRALRKTSP